MHRADKAVLRLAVGTGLSVLIAYGLAVKLPFVVCVVTLLLAGVMMVPLLEHYPMAGLMLTAVVLYAVYFRGALAANPLTTILVIAFTAIPVAGVMDQALVAALSRAFAVGLAIGVLVSGISHDLFPDAPAPASA